MAGYYFTPKTFRNYWLLIVSLIFFSWGGVSYAFILIGSIIVNYAFGRFIENNREKPSGYRWLIAGVSCNLILLGVFKYANFFTQNISDLLETLSLAKMMPTQIALPVGISFYTFHSLSYLVDIYQRKTLSQKNIFNLALYISMFSQLVAGPIIRYNDVWQQLTERTHTLFKFSSGIERFIIGLAKKVLLANTFGLIADSVFSANPSHIGAINAWLGIICYTLQIYCDFAGYSDMAIGLGRMFGFEFMENFNFPYMAKSVKEFWKRWHISLSSFFRDYVYIPLGGNRVKKSRQYVNLIIVFLLTGFWHGASWKFIAWGIFHGVFLILERLFLGKILEKTWKPIANIYTLLVVIFAWVLFRSDTLDYAVSYWRALFDFSTTTEQLSAFLSYMNKEFYTAFAFAILGSFGFFRFLGQRMESLFGKENALSYGFGLSYHLSSAIVYATLLLLCAMYLIANTYNPFIYYKF